MIMVERIVKMTFKTVYVPDFLALFHEVSDLIRQQEGCQSLALWQDKTDPAVLFTYSRWQSDADLDRYRRSELFQQTWARTKAMFQDKAQAWSLQQIAAKP
jgi:quinol monooxygenase YgiN